MMEQKTVQAETAEQPAQPSRDGRWEAAARRAIPSGQFEHQQAYEQRQAYARAMEAEGARREAETAAQWEPATRTAIQSSQLEYRKGDEQRQAHATAMEAEAVRRDAVKAETAEEPAQPNRNERWEAAQVAIQDAAAVTRTIGIMTRGEVETPDGTICALARQAWSLAMEAQELVDYLRHQECQEPVTPER